jgi:hypothetical protein
MDKKISDLQPMSQPKNEDMLAIVDTINPTYVTKRIAVVDLKNNFLLPIEIADVTNLQQVLDTKISYQSIIDGGSY